ncbi:MAG: MFS transporter [Halieaceae bacterium]|jgi:predicted MFS family arabinose efflux permease|nr:MFS transporter [Halieaceae bacterium]
MNSNQHPAARDQLGTRAVVLLAVASAIVTANAYYIHPIIGRVAESFGVSAGLIGAVPAFNQIALALGVLLLLPLGDRMTNRTLVALCLSAQVLALLAMATVQRYALFVAASTLLGFFTITPYLLPAYASKRVDGTRLGFVTALLTTGVVFGVQFSRLGSGVIAEQLGWRAVYWIAAALMACAVVALPLLMGPEAPLHRDRREPYAKLLLSLIRLPGRFPDVMVSGLIQGLSFAIFLAMWMGIGLHLTGPRLQLGTDIVGYLAAASAIGLMTTPRLGRWADGLGAEGARIRMAVAQFTAVASLALASYDWRLLIVPVVATAVSGPLIDITGRMTLLNRAPEIRTRLMSLYITLMFLGGGFGSWSGTLAYDALGWWGTVGLCLSLSSIACLLALHQHRRAVNAAAHPV